MAAQSLRTAALALALAVLARPARWANIPLANFAPEQIRDWACRVAAGESGQEVRVLAWRSAEAGNLAAQRLQLTRDFRREAGV